MHYWHVWDIWRHARYCYLWVGGGGGGGGMWGVNNFPVRNCVNIFCGRVDIFWLAESLRKLWLSAVMACGPNMTMGGGLMSVPTEPQFQGVGLLMDSWSMEIVPWHQGTHCVDVCQKWLELIFLAIDEAIAMLFCMIIYANSCRCHYVGEVTLRQDLSAPCLCLLAHPSIKLVT